MEEFFLLSLVGFRSWFLSRFCLIFIRSYSVVREHCRIPKKNSDVLHHSPYVFYAWKRSSTVMKVCWWEIMMRRKRGVKNSDSRATFWILLSEVEQDFGSKFWFKLSKAREEFEMYWLIEDQDRWGSLWPNVLYPPFYSPFASLCFMTWWAQLFLPKSPYFISVKMTFHSIRYPTRHRRATPTRFQIILSSREHCCMYHHLTVVLSDMMMCNRCLLHSVLWE